MKIAFIPIVRGFASKVLRNKSEISTMIQRNEQSLYTRVFVPEPDEYVTCCENEQSFYANKQSKHRTRAGSWEKGDTFKVISVTSIGGSIGIYGVNHGVYLEGVRMATEEEINKITKH